MKIISVFLCFGIFILSCLKSFAQDTITETWVAERYGKRFISAKEAGFENLKIPYTIQDLQYDKMSWLVPFEMDGKPQYRMIQARYSPNESEKNDTLSLQEAEKVIQIIIKAGRNFPNRESLKFFKTKDLSYKDGEKCYKTIALSRESYSIIDLPVNVSIVLKEGDSTSYVKDIAGGIEISLDFSKKSKGEEMKGYCVMTLIRLTPSR